MENWNKIQPAKHVSTIINVLKKISHDKNFSQKKKKQQFYTSIGTFTISTQMKGWKYPQNVA